jgi:hypothetical protein
MSTKFTEEKQEECAAGDKKRQWKEKEEDIRLARKNLNYGSLPGLLSHNSPMLGGQSPAPNCRLD